MKSILAVALVVSVASIALSQAPAPKAGDAEFAKQPQRWEYKVTQRGGHSGEPEAWEKHLNEMAKDGWELDLVDDGRYIFRRFVEHKR